MSSNLRVDRILPSTGTEVGVGTATGSVALYGDVNIAGTLTYEDVTNIDSVGVVTARSGLHVTSGNVAIGHNNPLNTLHVKGPTGGVSARFTDAVNSTVFVSHPSSGKSKIADAGGNYGFEFDTASVNILSGGSERVRIKSNGNIGIATDNPAQKLHIWGNSATTALSIGDNSLIEPYVLLEADASNNVSTLHSRGNHPLTFEIQQSEKVRIQNDGKVYINQQASVGATAKLEVTGTLDNSYPEYSFPLMVNDDAAYNSSGGPGGGIGFAFKQNSGGAWAQAGGIRGVKENTTDGNYASALTFYTRPNGGGVSERLRIKSNGEIRQQSTGGSTIYELKRSDSNTTGAVGTINFTASDAHSVASMSAMGDGDNEGAHMVFRTTSAAANNSPYNAATPERLRITSAGQLLHTRSDNTTRYDLEFRQTGGITDGNYSGIHWTQSATGSTNLAAIEIEYASTGRPDIVFKTRQSGGTAMSEAARVDSVGRFRIANQPAWNLRPNASSTQSTSAGSNVIGWSDNTSGSHSIACFLRGGVTLSGSTGSTSHNGSSTGRINVPVAGTYKVWCTIRCENTPGAGNIYLRVNGTTVARQHVEVWGRYNYAHGFHSHILNLTANSYIEWIVTINAGSHNISGYNDTVNWTGGHLIG